HHLHGKTRSDADRTVTSIEVDYDPDPQDNWFEKTFVFLIRDAGQLAVEVDTHRLGLFDVDEMLVAMREAGFDPAVSRWELSDLPPEGDYPIVTAVRRAGPGVRP